MIIKMKYKRIIWTLYTK